MKLTRSLGLLLFVTLTGCFSLARDEPQQHHYVLSGIPAQQVAAVSGTPTGLAIGVRRLQLATYLETPFIVTRRGTHEITFSEFHRWGERLDGGINHAVARYLTAGGRYRTVDIAPWSTRETYDYLIQMQVLRFEGRVPDGEAASVGEVHVLASWEIIRQLDGEVLARGTTDFREPGWRLGDYAGLVTSLDRGVSALSADLMSSIATLDARVAELR
jgi:uncharacterized protein